MAWTGHRLVSAALALALATSLSTVLSPVQATAASATTGLPVGRSYTGPPPVPAPGTCHARGVLPDPRCTPGATNPAVDQADIGSTICKAGWSGSVRPLEAYTEPLKRRLMASYAATYPIGDYELDHLVSLELGGAPSDPRNLWPEFGASPNPKDRVEDAAHAAVCDGRMSLAAAQLGIATNWVALGQRLGLGDLASQVPKPSGGATPTPPLTGSSSVGVSNKSSTGHYYRPGEYCPDRDLGKTITDPYGTMTCEGGGGGQPHWRAA